MEKTLGEIAKFINGELKGDGEVRITGVSSLDKATEGEISFFSDKRYKHHLSTDSNSMMGFQDCR